MSVIQNLIKEKRPNLADSSVKTYVSILTNLWKKVFGDEPIVVSKFNTHAIEFLHFLENIPYNKRKTTLSALFVITENPLYKTQMLNDIKTYNAETTKQEKTENDTDNWVSEEEIAKKLSELRAKALFLYKKKNLSTIDLQEIQDYILLILYSGLIPVRRSKDYCDFKIKNINLDKSNYLQGNNLIFNSYKTSKFYGKQMVTIPPQIKSILTKWISVNPTEWLLFDSNLNPMNAVKLNQRLNRLFGKKSGTGVNAMRHSFLSNKYGETIQVKKEMAKDLANMGSSLAQENVYIKG